ESLTLDINKALNLPNNTHGALVTGVTSGGPAAKAGIQPAQATFNMKIVGGDVITAIDKQPIRSSGDLIAYIFLKAKVGQTVTLTVLRNGKSVDVPVTLTARPQ
ncbi:MAG TPA: PDZ domain-containing protein, partial [Aggregatilineales bacterium]|nr:PDZ domain-containing protein [Aggregatilineales bacterium]